MICYKDKSYCGSNVTKHTCGREITPDELEDAKRIGVPIAYINFCEEE